MTFPGPQPRDFQFRCATCGTPIDFEDTVDGDCVDCARLVVDKKPLQQMTRHEKRRRKKIRSLERRVKRSKKRDQSTTTSGQKTTRGKSTNH